MAHYLHYLLGGVVLRKDLWDIALDQYGYVTERNARNMGAAPGELARLARRDKLERVGHGIYRFSELPATERDEYMLAVLWANTPDAALSHDTALAVYELCEINPDRIHITVPKGHRVSKRGGDTYVLHRARLAEADLSWWQGIRTVTEKTAIQQGIDTGVPVHLIRAAIDTARERGRITVAEATDLTAQIETTYV
ncbi:type IV toxin-antitoxin system AbiEi family antitoxin domain-containing protein [Microbacterium sp.]|uniref:type IV toxin-antitoxin system AbiEi family antitoxin domain-containing protein n=1 Tax=Microbacterium sp. TaxID=51671 RepID=UPI003221775D